MASTPLTGSTSKVLPGTVTSLEAVASIRLLEQKTFESNAQYQILIKHVVAARRVVLRIVASQFAHRAGCWPHPHVQHIGCWRPTLPPRNISGLRLLGVSPRRVYLEYFANRIFSYTWLFPSGAMDEMNT